MNSPIRKNAQVGTKMNRAIGMIGSRSSCGSSTKLGDNICDSAFTRMYRYDRKSMDECQTNFLPNSEAQLAREYAVAKLKHFPNSSNFENLSESFPIPQLGHIVVESGLLSPSNLHHALKIAVRDRQPLGRTLVASGFVDKTDISNVLLALQMISRNNLSRTRAIYVIRLAHSQGISFERALSQLKYATCSGSSENSLCELLVAGGVVTEVTSQECEKFALECGLPIGCVLTITTKLRVRTLDTLIHALVSLRDRKISRTEAVEGLKRIIQSPSNSDEQKRILHEVLKVDLERVYLGQLLRESQLINEEENVLALERSMITGRLFGEEIAASGFLPREMVENALKMQHLINCDVISLSQGCSALIETSRTGIDTYTYVCKAGMLRDSDIDKRIFALLIQTKLLEKPAAAMVERLNGAGIGSMKLALASVQVGAQTYREGKRMLNLIDGGKLTERQAVKNFERSFQCSFTSQDLLSARKASAQLYS